MNVLEGTLHFISSKNPPVFATPMTIRYTRPPEKGEAFLFGRDRGFDRCNLSLVQKISKFDGFIVIKTLNSYYVLADKK